MLPDHVRELLAAAVDGELSPADRARCRRLRAENPEADALYRRLKADRNRVNALPIVLPPAGLHERIMAALPPVAVPASPAVSPKADRRLVGLGLAASVALAAGVAVFLANRPANDLPQVAVQTPPPKPPRLDRPAEPRTPQPVDEPQPAQPGAGQGGTQAALPPPGPDRLEGSPRPARPDLSASPPFAPPSGFGRAVVRVPFLAPAADLPRDDIREALAAALGRDPAVRVDLFARDTGRGLDRLQAAAKAAGLTVHADAPALERARRRPGMPYLLYTESLTPAEAAELLAGAADADAADPPAAFETAHAAPAASADAKDVKELVGVDLGPGKRAAPDPAGGAKPLAAGTADQVAKSVTGFRAGDKPVVLVPLLPPGSRPPSAPREFRQFLDAAPRKPATIPVVIVIRPPGG